MNKSEPPITQTAKPKWRHTLNQRLSFWLFILIVITSIGFIKQYQLMQQQQAKQHPLLPVVVASATTKDIPVYISALGNVTATYTVTVKTRVTGELMQILFKEGQAVKAGDIIAEIDPRPFLAELTQYEGQLMRDQALLANALVDLKRYQQLWKQDSISQQTLATQQALVKQYQGAIKIDEGLIQATNVNLIYCHITSPIDGRVGLRLVDAGNLVQASDTTGIAIINTISPITVIFPVAEDNVPAILAQIDANKTLTVRAYDRQQNKLLSTGKLLTMDNQIDTSTGTVKLRAQFENKDNHLFPNQFVNIKLLVNKLKQATVVPTAAIQHTPQGDLVYAVKENRVKTIRIISGMSYQNDTVIQQGLKPGEQVVIEGADKITDGTKVRIANK